MESTHLLHGVVFLLAFVSVNCRMLNVTFTNQRGQYVLQSPNYPNNAPAFSRLIWELNSPPGSRVVLTCTEIRLFKRPDCKEGSVTVWDGMTQYVMCSAISSFRKESVGNKMFVQFKAGSIGFGRFTCRASVEQAQWTDVFPDAGGSDGAKTTSCPCGWTNRRRIVGGKETQINEYVWPVNIKHPGDKQGFCGGSIITERHILTAAHCIYGITKPLQVVVGEHDFDTALETNATEVIPVTRSVMHEQYHNDDMTHDIAILVLSRNIVFSQLVGPVCLPSERYPLQGQTVKVMGWGMTKTNGSFSSRLKETDLQIIDLKTCAERYTNPIDLRNRKQLCSYGDKTDSCQGDSGGPLVYQDPMMNRYVQVGLVSYGKECASADPAVNVDVFAYKDWIRRAVSLSHTPQLTTCAKI